MEPCLPAFWREFYMGFECGRRNSSQSDQTGNYCLLPLQNTDDCGRTLRCHVITVLYGHFCRKLWYAGWGRLLWEETLCGWCLRRESETVWEPPRGCCWRKVLSLTATPACIDSFTVGGCGRDGPGHTTHEPAGAYSPPSRGLKDPFSRAKTCCSRLLVTSAPQTKTS